MNGIDTLRNASLLYAAWLPLTKQYYLLKEDGTLTAVLFAERQDFEDYAAAAMEQGLTIEATEERDSMLLYAELWRCGVGQVRLAGTEELIPLGRLFTPPDEDDKRPADRLVPDPMLTGKILWLMQNVRLGTPTAEMEADMLRSLRDAVLIGPVAQDSDGDLTVPLMKLSGLQALTLFTDRREFMAAYSGREAEFGIKIYDIAELCELMQRGLEAVVINCRSGAPLMLDRELLEAAKRI